MDTEVKQTIEENSGNEMADANNVCEEQVISIQQEKSDLEAMKKALEAKAKELAKWQIDLSEKESSLQAEALRIQQEKLILEEREKNAEADLNQKINAEYAEAKLKLSDEQSKSRESFVAELERKRVEFEKSRQQAISDLSKELESLRTNAQKEIDAARRNQEEELQKRREETERELQQQRSDNQAAIKEDKEKALNQLNAEMAQRTAELTREENDLSNERDRVKAENDRVEALEREIAKREDDLKDQQRVLEREKRRLEREKQRIDEADSNLTEVVNQKIEDTIKNLRLMIDTKNQELDNLREQLSSAVKENELVNSFKEAYGDDPQVLIQRMKQLEESNTTLRNQLSNSSDKSELDNLETAYRETKSELDRVLEENRHLNDSQGRFSSLEAQFRTLDSEHKSLQATCESLENQLEAKNQELIRISTPEGRVADRDARIAAIMTGALEDKKDLIGAGEGYDSRSSNKDEIAWLENVWSKCEQYGIKFNKRILYAFHTALKINEWSTITVLAGVSGTGKSELPRLYAEFGGLNFCSVAVQPNWDSQESMLGFFNSIDNQFEPEKLLKFLVQCTTDPYELIFKPKDTKTAKFSEAKVHWYKLEHYSISDLKSPKFPRKLSWDELAYFRGRKGDIKNVYHELETQYELINNGYEKYNLSDSEIRVDRKGNRFGQFDFVTKSGQEIVVSWSESAWEKGAKKVDKLSVISFIPFEDKLKDGVPRYRIKDLKAVTTSKFEDLWFKNKKKVFINAKFGLSIMVKQKSYLLLRITLIHQVYSILA